MQAVGNSYARSDWSFWCQPYMPPDEPQSYMNRLYGRVAYAYFLLKVADLLDTVFFVLRKKTNQISFLHIYHHSIMVLTSYYCTKNLVMGHLALMPIINMFVHSLMYTYYLVTCIKPELKESMWWKKHITQVQMVICILYNIYFMYRMWF